MTLVGKVEETAKALRRRGGRERRRGHAESARVGLKSAPKELQDAVSAALTLKDAEIAKP